MATGESRKAQFKVQKQDQGLLLQGELFQKLNSEWFVQEIDGHRILVSPLAEGKPLDQVKAVAAMPISIFAQFLLSLQQSEWSGLISVDTSYGTKRLYFSRGEIVFAGSNLIDDRLGEVIFREARISLDELTQSAAQVTKTRKFGQVLVASGVMTQVGLWRALTQQVMEIIRSIFLVDRVFFEIQTGNSFASTEITLPTSTRDLLQSVASFGNVFRTFLGRLNEQTEVHLLLENDALAESFPTGSFTSDMISLVRQFPNVQKLIDNSKLMNLYTVLTLFQLSYRGIVKFTPELEEVPHQGRYYHQVRSRLDAYAFVLNSVQKAFNDANKEFPVRVLEEFVLSPEIQARNTLSLQKNGDVDKESVLAMISQVEAIPDRFYGIDRQIESLIQFLLQLAGDSLNFSLASKIREEYRSISN